MNNSESYKKILKIAFYFAIGGMLLSFFFKGNLGVFGTLLIMIAFVLAVIASIKKKKSKKN